MKKGYKKGQIWVETVIYTLIALVMIGVVLSVVKPRIEEAQDKTIIESSINMLEDINTIFLTIKGVVGNKRLIQVSIKKGALEIDGENNQILFEMESEYEYSEPGKNVSYGNVIANTKKTGKTSIVTLTTNYADEYDIQYKGEDEKKLLTQSQTPYKIFITNKGGIGKTIMDLEIV